MIVGIDDSSPTPPYEQLRAQIVALASSGALLVGARLPSVRQLADDLGLAPGTVARAYRELERDGNVQTRGRHGTFVASAGDLSNHARARQLEQAALDYARRVAALRVPASAAVAAVDAALREAATGRRGVEPLPRVTRPA